MYLFSVAPYHSECFSRDLKGCQKVIVGKTPSKAQQQLWCPGVILLLAPIVLLMSETPASRV